MKMLDEDTLWAISSGHCPTCGHRGFCIGPQGGAAINIECGNIECRQRFNVTFRSGEALLGHELGSGFDSGTMWPSEPPR